MSITPIDISMMQRMNDVAQIRQNEIQRPDMMQNAITQSIDKQVNHNAESVRKKNDSDKSDTKHDAREKGKNEYFFNGNTKKKNPKEELGTIAVKKKNSFDMKV